MKRAATRHRSQGEKNSSLESHVNVMTAV